VCVCVCVCVCVWERERERERERKCVCVCERERERERGRERESVGVGVSVCISVWTCVSVRLSVCQPLQMQWQTQCDLPQLWTRCRSSVSRSLFPVKRDLVSFPDEKGPRDQALKSRLKRWKKTCTWDCCMLAESIHAVGNFPTTPSQHDTSAGESLLWIIVVSSIVCCCSTFFWKHQHCPIPLRECALQEDSSIFLCQKYNKSSHARHFAGF